MVVFCGFLATPAYPETPPDATQTPGAGGAARDEVGQAPATEALSDDISKLITQLRSAEFEKREAATAELFRLPPERLNEVEAALTQEKDVEAATRLRTVALHLFLKRENSYEGTVALLGIVLNLEPVRLDAKHPDQITMSVAINQVQPGFPAAETLKPGDRLVALDGRPFGIDLSVDAFRQMVNEKRPGTVMNFTVVRGGRVMKAGVKLVGVANAGSIQTFVDQRMEHGMQYQGVLTDATAMKPLVVEDAAPPEDATEKGAEGFRIIRQGDVIRIVPAR